MKIVQPTPIQAKPTARLAGLALLASKARPRTIRSATRNTTVAPPHTQVNAHGEAVIWPVWIAQAKTLATPYMLPAATRIEPPRQGAARPSWARALRKPMSAWRVSIESFMRRAPIARAS